ncbi:MAG: hypothetical protein ABIO43_11965 [Sphingomicrobium sp.]
MNFELLERAWRSSANSPSEAAKTYLMEEMMEALKERHRDFRGFMIMIGLTLSAWTLKIAYDLIFQPFPFDLVREWAALPLLLMPWAALVFIGAQYKRHRNAFPDPYRSTPDTLRALIDENDVAQARTRWMAGMALVCIVLLAIMLGQLMSVGKMSGQNVFQGSILFGSIFAAVWAHQGWHYLRKLRPEGERLRRLLADYQD